MIQGSLDMLVLQVLSLEDMHGWGITKRIQQASEGALQVNQGSLYTSLLRMTRSGWIASEWRVTENNRRAKYYTLTNAGKKQLGVEEERWSRLTTAVARVMELT